MKRDRLWLIPFFLFMVNYDEKTGTTKTLPLGDRPREKLLLQGKTSLTDAELIAILIGSGSKNETSVGLSQRILAAYNDGLYELGGATPQELQKFHGVGEAKAVTIVAALELGRRRKNYPTKKKDRIACSNDAFEILHPLLSDLDHEQFWVLMLNNSNQVMRKQMISKGGRAGTVADPKIIFNLAVQHHATSIIIAHNHPSGSLKPSAEDLLITKKLIDAGSMLDLRVLDHLIITTDSYTSFADEKLI